MNKKLVGLVFLCICTMQLVALELRDGRMRLVVDERSGRFSVYYQTDAGSQSWLALLYDQENKTSYPTLVFDQRTFKLGDSSDFRTVVSRQGSSIVIEYRSSFCTVVQSMSFVSSSPGMAANGLLIRFNISNTGERDAAIGLRFLFDTWLGEQASRHFLTDTGTLLTNETLIRPDSPIKWLVSPRDSQAGAAFFFDINGQRPDSIIVANWKRLNDVPWAFDSLASRNFTLLPYSINDSAVAYYYNPQTIRRGASREISIILGAAFTGTFQSGPLASTQETGTAVINQLVSDADKLKLDLDMDILAARELLDRINSLLDSKTSLDTSQLEIIENALKKLEERQGSY